MINTTRSYCICFQTGGIGQKLYYAWVTCLAHTLNFVTTYKRYTDGTLHVKNIFLKTIICVISFLKFCLCWFHFQNSRVFWAKSKSIFEHAFFWVTVRLFFNMVAISLVFLKHPLLPPFLTYMNLCFFFFINLLLNYMFRWTALMVARSWHRDWLEDILSQESAGNRSLSPTPYLCLPLMSIVNIARWAKSYFLDRVLEFLIMCVNW